MEQNRTKELMLAQGIPLTRENFIASHWPQPPEEWTGEHEAELPAELQDWTQFGFEPQRLETPLPRPAPRPKDRGFTQADQAKEMRTIGQIGETMQQAGVPLPGPNDPLSENVEDRTTPLYTRAYDQEQGRLRGPTLDVAKKEVK